MKTVFWMFGLGAVIYGIVQTSVVNAFILGHSLRIMLQIVTQILLNIRIFRGRIGPCKQKWVIIGLTILFIEKLIFSFHKVCGSVFLDSFLDKQIIYTVNAYNSI